MLLLLRLNNGLRSSSTANFTSPYPHNDWFRNLRQVTAGYFDRTTEPAAVVTRRSDGRYSIEHPRVREPPILFGGDAEPFERYVQILPGRGLKPLAPKPD